MHPQPDCSQGYTNPSTNPLAACVTSTPVPFSDSTAVLHTRLFDLFWDKNCGLIQIDHCRHLMCVKFTRDWYNFNGALEVTSLHVWRYVALHLSLLLMDMLNPSGFTALMKILTRTFCALAIDIALGFCNRASRRKPRWNGLRQYVGKTFPNERQARQIFVFLLNHIPCRLQKRVIPVGFQLKSTVRHFWGLLLIYNQLELDQRKAPRQIHYTWTPPLMVIDDKYDISVVSGSSHGPRRIPFGCCTVICKWYPLYPHEARVMSPNKKQHQNLWNSQFFFMQFAVSSGKKKTLETTRMKSIARILKHSSSKPDHPSLLRSSRQTDM